MPVRPADPWQEDRLERTFLFTDIVASTEALEQIGVRRWSWLLERHRKSITVLAQSHHGHVASFLGDGFMVVFENAADAALCAIRLQYAFLAQGELRVRIGAEAGEVMLLGEHEFVGLCIHTAARLCDLCEEGQLLLGDRCVELARSSVALPGLKPVDLRLRGRTAPVRSYLSEAPEAPWLP